MRTLEIELPSERDTSAFGATLAQALRHHAESHAGDAVRADAPVVVTLDGELGAGKTTLVRACLRMLGVTGPVKSPTYTLLETYRTEYFSVLHFDLYRVADPEELEYLGARDQHTTGVVWFVEWPRRGEGWLPSGDLALSLAVSGTGRRVQADCTYEETPLLDALEQLLY